MASPLAPGAVTRIFLLDDHEVVRRGVAELLSVEDDLEVVGEAGTAAEALERIPLTKPDVALLDVQLPDGDGIEVCREVRASHPGVQCLMLTSFADDEALLGAVLAGAAGYVLKQIRGGDLVGSIRRAARGESLLDPDLVARTRARLSSERGDERLARLSPQERRILELIAEGRTNRDIGEEMFLAEKTVKNYVSNVLMKLDMKRRTEAAVFAVQARAAQRRQGYRQPDGA
jgi:two-component system response regulator DevR